MLLPEKFYQDQIGQASTAIASGGDAEGFESYPVLKPEGESPGRVLLSLTNVHVLPGEPEPALHKLHVSNADVPDAVVDQAREEVAGFINLNFAAMGNDGMRLLARRVVEACEELEAPSSLLIPFQTIGLMAVYGDFADSSVSCDIFAARPFVTALQKRTPKLPSMAEFPEELLKNMHALQAEQAPEPELYPSWRENMVDNLLAYNPDTEGRSMAIASMGPLLVPSVSTHPVLNSIVFGH